MYKRIEAYTSDRCRYEGSNPIDHSTMPISKEMTNKCLKSGLEKYSKERCIIEKSFYLETDEYRKGFDKAYKESLDEGKWVLDNINKEECDITEDCRWERVYYAIPFEDDMHIHVFTNEDDSKILKISIGC